MQLALMMDLRSVVMFASCGFSDEEDYIFVDWFVHDEVMRDLR